MDFSDSEGEENEATEQAKRVRSTSHSQTELDGSLTMSYKNQEGNVVTVTSRRDMNAKPAGKTPCDKKVRVALIAAFACMGSMLFGLDIGYIGPILESESFKHDVAHIDTGKISSSTEGMIVSLFSIGAMATSFPVVSSYFLDVWGRKASIMVGTTVFIFGSLIQGTSTGSTQLLLGRFIAGMSIGVLSSVIVLYQSELAPASMRGALSTLYQAGITFGILVASYMDQVLVEKKEGWRAVMALICIPAVGLLFGMVFLPRSPRWLVARGKRREALKVLLAIRSEREAIQEELEIYQETEKAKADGQPEWSELFRGRVLRLLILGVTLQLLQQLVGMNAFMYFGPKIFEAIGFSPNRFTTINNFVNFLSTFPAILLADRAGRRSLMLWSSIGMTIACGAMGTAGLMFVSKTVDDPATPNVVESGYTLTNPYAGWIITISAFFFVFNFAYGFGPIVWVYCSEIFPLRYRARCVGVCTMANWVGNFLIAQFTPMLLDSISFGTFYVFGFFCIISVFVSAWLPETKGVPLELIQQLFDNKNGFKSSARKRTLMQGDATESDSDSDSDSQS